ncbi:MAG: putative membrane protein SirB2 [Candidatus Azotimanducaceae bacterium]|jgi:uncharacterized membrane protein SirB2
MTTYSIALMLHIGAVVISGTFFLVRGIWMLQGSDLLTTKPVKVLPHIIDTILLLSAATLAYTLSAYPFADAWLTAKLLALVLYIGFGVLTLRGKTKAIRSAAFIAALLTFGYIVGVTLTRSAGLGWI